MTDGYQALRDGAAWLDLSARGRIVARGRDRARFLHNLTTQRSQEDDCPATPATPSSSRRRAASSATSTCSAVADDFLLDTEPELREKVRLHILEIQGRRPGGAGGRHRYDRRHRRGRPRRAAAARGRARPPPFTVTGQPGYRIYCAPRREAGSRSRLLEAAGVVAATAGGRPHRAHRKRQAALRRRHPRHHPAAGDANRCTRVSFNKGCYLGQEIVERIRARGHVNKHSDEAGTRRRRRPRRAPS